MLTIRTSFTALGWSIALLLAGHSPAQAAPVTFNTALPVAREQLVWREQFVARERSGGGTMDRDVSVRALESTLGYGVSAKLAVFGTVPYFLDQQLDVTTSMGRVGRDSGGIGDLSLFARYTVYQNDFPGGTFRVAPLAGFTAPTGDDGDRDRFGRLPRTLQAGDGAWDGFVSVVATWQTLQFQADAQLLYRENGRHDGFARGDVVRLDGSLQYRIWPRSLDGVSGVPGFVYAVVETNVIHAGRDWVNDAIGPDSGGSQWLLAPGLQYVSRRWIVEGAIQLPVADNLNGAAPEDDYAVRVGFRYNF